MNEYTVPLVDTDTGDGWDVDVEAENALSATYIAMEDCEKSVVVASPFISEHFDVIVQNEDGFDL